MTRTLITTAEIDDETATKDWTFGYRLYTFPLIQKKLSYDSAVEDRIFELGRTSINAFFTSEVAVRAVFERLENRPDWHIYCLQGKTRTALLKFVSEDQIIKAAPHSTALASMIKDDTTPVRQRQSVFFCGDKRMPTLPVTCKQLEIDLEELVCYNSSCRPSDIGGDIDGMFFFSPSAVECFFNHNPNINERTVLFAIGETTAAAISAFTNNKLIISPAPNQAALMNEAKKYFDQQIDPLNTPEA